MSISPSAEKKTAALATAPLYSPYRLGSIILKNRIVMAPMTRSRATAEQVPMPIMAEYYSKRASAGLIISEGTGPSQDGTGYPRIPGLWNDEQVEAWKTVTAAVHAKGGVIFVQIMHTGRESHLANMAPGSEIVAPSAIAGEGQIHTDRLGMVPKPMPRALSLEEIAKVRAEHVSAAVNAIAAGFDGVELHAANGYLLEQFLNPASNQRTDAYGGTLENRNRYVIEVADAVAKAIGGDRVGIRLSPYGTNNGMTPFPEIDGQYLKLLARLAETGIEYIHLVDHSAMGAPPVPTALKEAMSKQWPHTFIASGGFDLEQANETLAAGRADLIAFGRPFLANPDLVERLARGIPLTAPDPSTFFTPGPNGYTDL
ncbi:alkene reductase [Rhizobium lusitanum]|uniref:alkene reductase n=1 Tax=Rhizobium lusitanum TaxID=293958 RepID=UPI00195B3A69|nr:alkene reductase [Rhizobium lusitanum]MBM7045690.1 alkene reductase [Rhizobium lusitanum]